jgi:hypothetical protein
MSIVSNSFVPSFVLESAHAPEGATSAARVQRGASALSVAGSPATNAAVLRLGDSGSKRIWELGMSRGAAYTFATVSPSGPRGRLLV